jgi:hypothetical protein
MLVRCAASVSEHSDTKVVFCRLPNIQCINYGGVECTLRDMIGEAIGVRR